MRRFPEPELMNDPVQARAYAEADFSEANTLFQNLFLDRFPTHRPRRILDLGCGPGDITLAFARCFPDSRVDGIDGAEAMLAIARHRLATQPLLSRRVQFRRHRLPDPALTPGYDTLICNSLLHHLADPQVLWREIQRLGTPGAAVLVMDLYRPDSERQALELVERHAAGASAILRRDFFNSLRAAYREDEIRRQLEETGLDHFQVDRVSDRHIAVHGRLH